MRLPRPSIIWRIGLILLVLALQHLVLSKVDKEKQKECPPPLATGANATQFFFVPKGSDWIEFWNMWPARPGFTCRVETTDRIVSSSLAIKCDPEHYRSYTRFHVTRDSKDWVKLRISNVSLFDSGNWLFVVPPAFGLECPFEVYTPEMNCVQKADTIGVTCRLQYSTIYEPSCGCEYKGQLEAKTAYRELYPPPTWTCFEHITRHRGIKTIHCDYILPSSLYHNKGNLSARVNITLPFYQHTPITVSEETDLIFAFPEVETRNCPEDGLFTSASDKCECHLVKSGFPSGVPVWLDSKGVNVGTPSAKDSSTNILQQLMDAEPGEVRNYTCIGQSTIGFGKQYVRLTAKIAYGPSQLILTPIVRKVCKSNPDLELSCMVLPPIHGYLNNISRQAVLTVRSGEVDVVQNLTASTTNGFHVYTQTVRPVTEKDLHVECTVSEIVFDKNISHHVEQIIVSEVPPSSPPVITINGEELPIIDSAAAAAVNMTRGPNHYEVQCRVDGGRPAVSEVWLTCAGVTNHSVGVESTVNIGEVKMPMHGELCECSARHESGCYHLVSNFTINVIYPPQIELINCTSDYIKDIKPVTCQCHLREVGNPPGKPEWLNADTSGMTDATTNTLDVPLYNYSKGGDVSRTFSCVGVSTKYRTPPLPYTARYAIGPSEVYLEVFKVSQNNYCPHVFGELQVACRIPKSTINPPPDTVAIAIDGVQGGLHQLPRETVFSSYMYRFIGVPRTNSSLVNITVTVVNPANPDASVRVSRRVHLEVPPVPPPVMTVNGKRVPNHGSTIKFHDEKLEIEPSRTIDVLAGHRYVFRCQMSQDNPVIKGVWMTCAGVNSTAGSRVATVTLERIVDGMDGQMCECWTIGLKGYCFTEVLKYNLKVQDPPEVELVNCPKGYIREGTKTTCQCHLTVAGRPPGVPTWMDSRGNVISDVSRASAATQTLDVSLNSSAPTPTVVYSCAGITKNGYVGPSAEYTAKYAYGPSKVSITVINATSKEYEEDGRQVIEVSRCHQHSPPSSPKSTGGGGFTIACDVPIPTVNPRPQIGIEVPKGWLDAGNGSALTTPRGTYRNSYTINPQADNVINITCWARSEIDPDLRVQTSGLFRFNGQFAEPPPDIQVNGTDQPDGSILNVTSGHFLVVACRCKDCLHRRPAFGGVSVTCGNVTNTTRHGMETSITLTDIDSRMDQHIMCDCRTLRGFGCNHQGVSKFTLNVHEAEVTPASPSNSNDDSSSSSRGGSGGGGGGDLGRAGIIGIVVAAIVVIIIGVGIALKVRERRKRGFSRDVTSVSCQALNASTPEDINEDDDDYTAIEDMLIDG